MILQPYINTRAHLAEMMRRYDAHSELYNADIDTKRKAEQNKEKRKAYQTLKPTHRALYKDLILEIGKTMLQRIKIYQPEHEAQGGEGTFKLLTNRIVGDGYFLCSTNRYQLAKHNGKEKSTLTRNINRLMDAGIITERISHGNFKNFDLHIKAEFLIVSDRANPAYNPLQTAPAGAVLLDQENAFCNEKKNVQEHLINTINSEAVEFLNSSDSESPVSTGTLTGTAGKLNEETAILKPFAALQTFKPTGGAADIQLLKNEHGIDNVRVFTKREPEQWHGFHRIAYSAYFVDYLIDTIYNSRGIHIFPETRLLAIRYAREYYFPDPLNRNQVKTIFKPCETMNDYETRFNGLRWCIDAADRHAARHEAFFVLPMQYIDVNSATKNAFINTLEWFKNAKQTASDKAKYQRNRDDLKKLHAKVRELHEQKTSLAEAEAYIETNLPKYKYVFRHSVVTVVNEVGKK